MISQVARTGSIQLVANDITDTGQYNFSWSDTGTYQISNAYSNSTSSSTWGRLTPSYSSRRERTSTAYIEFDKSLLNNIPSNASAFSITCNIAYKVYSTNTVSALSLQLYTDTTPKGSARTSRPTSNSTYSITPGTWNRNELNNIRLYISLTRSTSGNSTSGYLDIYGIELIINYSYTTNVYEINTSTVSPSTITFNPTSLEIDEGEDGSITINNITDLTTTSITDNGNNIVNDLVHISGTSYRYDLTNVQEDHTLIARQVTSYNIIVQNNSINVTKTIPTSSGKTAESSDFDIKFIPTNINYIDIYDTNVKKDISNLNTWTEVFEDSIILNPSSYTNPTSGYFNSTGNLSYGYNSTSNTSNYARLQISDTGSTKSIDYNFNVSSIPNNAIITSVSCSFRICVNGSLSSTDTGVQLYSGNTAKSSRNYSDWYDNTTSAVYLLTGIETFTRQELNDIKLKITGRTNRSGRYIQFYGANLYIEYEYEGDTYYIYTVSNVQSTRTIRFEDKTKYNITSSSSMTGVSVSPSSTQVYEGNDITLEIIGVTSPNEFKLLDNNSDVTSSVVAPISNTYEVTTQVSGAEYGFSLNGNGYYESTNQGENDSIALARINFEFDSASEITIQYINYAEATYDYGIFGYLDTALSTSAEADSNALKRCNNSDDNSPDPQTIIYQIPAGSHFIDIKYFKDTYTGNNNDSLQWKILDSQSSSSDNYTYTITNVVGNHILRIEENTHYSVSGTSEFDGKTISGTSNKVYEGDSITLTLTGITNPYSFILTDNDVDVTSTIVGDLSNEYQITEKVSEATYGFELNDNGYYESTNQGIDESTSVCRINFNCSIPYEVTIQYINYAEATYDYGIFGNVDSVLGTTSTADSNTFKTCSETADNSSNPQILVYTIPAGNHFIDIKYRKDSGTDSYNDSLQWKILNIGPASGVSYTYTINNVSSNHTLVLSEKTKHIITTSSTFDGVTISPDGINYIYQNEYIYFTITSTEETKPGIKLLIDDTIDVTSSISGNKYRFNDDGSNHELKIVEQPKYTVSGTGYNGITVSISTNPVYHGSNTTIIINNVTDISEITIYDNSKAITGRFELEESSYVYILTNITTNHTITIGPHVTYTITSTNNTETPITIIPTGTKTIDAGDLFTIGIMTNDVSHVKVLDNLVDTSSKLVYVAAQNNQTITSNPYEVEDVPNGFVNNYPATNAFYPSTNTQRHARINVPLSSTIYAIFNLTPIELPEFATINSISCIVRAYVPSNYIITPRTVQLYSGTTAKGSATTLRTSSGTSNLDCGTWTVNELKDIKLRFDATETYDTTSHIRFYGATFTVNYTIPEHYEYTLEDISTAHTVVFSEVFVTVFSKASGTWSENSKIYEKRNGSWVQVEGDDILTLFDTHKIYIRK